MTNLVKQVNLVEQYVTEAIDYRKLKKQWVEAGEAPSWVSTNAVQFFSQKYAYRGESWKSRIEAVCRYLADNAPSVYPDWWGEDEYTKGLPYYDVFFKLRWDGFTIDSTPLLSNAGLLAERGMTISCSGQTIFNNLANKAFAMGELEQLIKNGHGCAWTIPDWLAEGDLYGDDGNRSDGILPVIEEAMEKVQKTNQGVRRGACAFNVNVEHGDFDKVADFLYKNNHVLNLGWIIKDEFIKKIFSKDKEALRRFGRIVQIRMLTGKGYFLKTDTMNRNKADVFKELALEVYGSNLCTELNLFADEDYTFSCPIINTNLTLYRSFPKHLHWLTMIMQDANVTGYLKQIEQKKGKSRLFLDKIHRFTEEFRAVGCGTAGFHSLLMQERIVYGSFESEVLNDQIFSEMQRDTYEASKWLGKVCGVPKGLQKAGICRRNATTMFSPPTKSSAEYSRNTPSEGIGLQTALIKVKEVTGSDIWRIEPAFLSLLKEKGLYTPEMVKDIAQHNGSIQHLDCFTEHEKKVFKTAFEIDMIAHLKMCAGRQPYFDQQQSINIYLSGSDSVEYITEVHLTALALEGINSLYYCYSIRDGQFVREIEECLQCQ